MNYPWFRMWAEARNDKKLETLSDAQFRVWFKLLCYASDQKPSRGVIDEYDPEILAIEVSACDWPLLKDTLSQLARLRIIEPGWEDGPISFIHFEDRQYDKPSDRPGEIKKRVQKHREAQKNGVTPSEPGVTEHEETPCNAMKRDETHREEKKREDKRREDSPPISPAGGMTGLPPIPERSEDVTVEMLRLYATVVPPTPVLVAAEAMRRCWAPGQGRAFFEHHENRGWKLSGRQKMRNWHLAMNTWERSQWFPPKVDPSVYTQQAQEKPKRVLVPDFSYDPGPPAITVEKLREIQRNAPGLYGLPGHAGHGKHNGH